MNKNITSLILIVIAIGIYFTYTQGQINTDYSILDVNNQYTTAINNAKSLQAIRDSVQRDYNKISLENRVSIDDMIPSSIDNIHLIVDVSRLANRNGFALKNIKADVVQSNNTPNAANAQNAMNAANSGQPSLLPNMSLASVKLSFDTSTSYDRFIGFMQELERSLRIADITKLTIKANDSGVYDFSVELNTYWLKQ